MTNKLKKDENFNYSFEEFRTLVEAEGEKILNQIKNGRFNKSNSLNAYVILVKFNDVTEVLLPEEEFARDPKTGEFLMTETGFPVRNPKYNKDAKRHGKRKTIPVAKHLRLSGGHIKMSSIENIIRRKWLVYDFYLPSHQEVMADIDTLKKSERAVLSGGLTNIMKNGISAYTELGSYLQGQKDKLHNMWNNTDMLKEKDAKITNLEARVKQMQKQIKDGKPKSDVVTPEKPEKENPKNN